MSDDHDAAEQDILATIQAPGLGSLWKHFKGNIYVIFGHALSSEDKSPQVIYRDINTGVLWVRPLSEWREEVIPDEDGPRARFRPWNPRSLV